MIVAITGGTGFIGKKLVARLVGRGDTVRLLTRSPMVTEKQSSSFASKFAEHLQM